VTPLLQIRGLIKRYFPEVPPAVDGLSFEVFEGEILALLGPSGCGKTTALRLIAGFETPDHGTVIMEGRTLAGDGRVVRPESRRVGFVFQEFALFPHLDVQRNIEFGLRGLTRSDRRARALEVLKMVDLSEQKSRRVQDLSGGEQQRVALARSMAPAPRVILLDEPFSNLDQGLRETTRREVRVLLQRLGMTAVLVTHDQEEALTFADRIGVLRAGQLDQIATPEEIYADPATPFVAEFLGSTNLIRGVARGGVAATPLGVLRLNRPAHGQVLLSIRPEHLSLEDAVEGEAAGRVVERRFKGHDLTFRVNFGDEQYLVHADYRCDHPVGHAVRIVPRETAVVVEAAAG